MEGRVSATLPSSSNSNKPERPPPTPGWQQIWVTLKSSTRRLLRLDDKGLQ
jgi:hypothetical protein